MGAPRDIGLIFKAQSDYINRPETAEMLCLFISKIDSFAYLKKSDGTVIPFPTLGGPPSGAAGGDLSGTYPNPTVNKIQGRTVGTNVPLDGYGLIWNSGTSKWDAAIITPHGNAGGDLNGSSYPNPVISSLQGNSLGALFPGLGDILTYDGAQWTNLLPASQIQYTDISLSDATANEIANLWTEGYYRVGSISNNSNIVYFYSRTYRGSDGNLRLNTSGFCLMLLSDGTTYQIADAQLSFLHQEIIQLSLPTGIDGASVNQVVKLSTSAGVQDISLCIRWGDANWNSINFTDPSISIMDSTNYINNTTLIGDTIEFQKKNQFITGLNAGCNRSIIIAGDSSLQYCIVASNQSLTLKRNGFAYFGTDFSKGYFLYKAIFSTEFGSGVSADIEYANDFKGMSDFKLYFDGSGSFTLDGGANSVYDTSKTWFTVINGNTSSAALTFGFSISSSTSVDFYTFDPISGVPGPGILNDLQVEFNTPIY